MSLPPPLGRCLLVIVTSAVFAGPAFAGQETASPQPANAATPPRSSDVTIRGCLTGSKLTRIDPSGTALTLPDTLTVSSIRVIRAQVKALSGHWVELIGKLDGVPGQETGVLIASSDRAKLYFGGGDPNLGSDLRIGRPETPEIHANTIKDLAPTCETPREK